MSIKPLRFALMMSISLLGCDANNAAAAAASDSLASGFSNPPNGARPRVWWHWMDGNVTKDGIAKDLAWLHRVGIGGVDEIDASFLTPAIVKDRLVYMSPEWKDAFRYAAALAGKYGMEFGIDSSAGWSETGAPFVAQQDAMKKLVWSATQVDGGEPFHGVLTQPPSNTGPFQNVPLTGGGLIGPTPQVTALRFYRDSVVVAYREPVSAPAVKEAVSNSGPLDAKALSDGDLTDGPVLKAVDGRIWAELRYAEPVQIEGATLAVKGAGVVASLEASDDENTWKAVSSFASPDASPFGSRNPVETTTSFAPTTARYFRVTFTPAPTPPPLTTTLNPAPGTVSMDPSAFMPAAKGPITIHLDEFALYAHATVNAFEAKAGFSIAPDYYAIASTAPVAAGTAVSSSDVANLTDRVKPDGTLDWTPPPGHWVVLRMGYSLEGTTNHPAPKEATGLEVDKLSKSDVTNYMEHYLGAFQAIAGPFGSHGVNAVTADSTEVGAQNWTDDILQQFRQLRGYDPTPWLPALTGVVVESPERSDRFLWDFRRTIDELLARNHYQVIAAIARAHGLTNYGEALEDHRPSFGDDMEMRQYTGVPMGAMWMYGAQRGPNPTYVADLRGAASIAHIYGQNTVGAESMDSVMQPWAYAPRDLKPVVDLEFALGVNRIVIHSSVEQPMDNPPGMSMAIIGQYFNRLENWADEAGAWIRYIARCSYLLQQGRAAPDVAYFYGQEAPLTGLFGDRAIDMPAGYGFDFVNSDVLINKLSMDHGALATASGMHYKILYLGGSSAQMTVDVLRRIRDLVRQGAVVVGRRPDASPSLRDDPAEFKALADEVFGSDAAERNVGAGKVFPSGSLADALAALKLAPDFEYTKPEPDTELLGTHRHLKDGELYFVTNRLNRPESVTATFRTTGRAPELWDAVTGQRSPTNFTASDGRTNVALDLPAYGSIFVIFHKPLQTASRALPAAQETPLMALDGPWTVTFQPDRGAPDKIEMDSLQPWNANADPGVKFFSGSGTYTKTFSLPHAKAGGRILLDLGELHEMADVTVNGKDLGEAWTPPFRIDVTRAVHPGENRLVVKVTNLWVNRLIGDQQPNAKKYTATYFPTYRADAPLRTSGLLGPVRLVLVPEGGKRR